MLREVTHKRVRQIVPTEEELVRTAKEALDGDGNLEKRFNALVFPERKPRLWGTFHWRIKEAWDRAVEYYFLERLERGLVKTPRKRREGNKKVSVPEAWDVILASLKHEDRYRRLTWGDLSQRLGITTRATQYQIVRRLGFLFGGIVPDRNVLAGPCISCGVVRPVDELRYQHCSQCFPEADEDFLLVD